MRVRRHRANHALDETQVLEAPRAAIALDDFLHRTPEIDVDELGSEHVGHERRRIPHCLWIRTEDLHADGALVRPEPQLVERRGILAPDPLGRQKLGHDDVRAERPAQPAERRFGHPSHGRQKQRDLLAHAVRKWHKLFKVTAREKACNVKICHDLRASLISPPHCRPPPASRFDRHTETREAAWSYASSSPRMPSNCNSKAPPRTTFFAS